MNRLKAKVSTVEEVLLLAHECVHSDVVTELEINGELFTAAMYERAGCKHIKVCDIDYVEQNKSKESKWGYFARKGHNITWGIRKQGSTKPWLLCVDGVVIPPGERSTMTPKRLSGLINEKAEV